MKSNLWKDANHLVELPVDSVPLYNGKLLHVYKDTVELPDGSRSAREWIKHPGASAVVPVFEDGTIMLVKQFRYPPRQIFYEVPAGKIDPDEPPHKTALRETEEETGLKATSIAYIGHFYPVIGYSDEIIHIYAAWDLKQLSKGSDEDEFLINERIPFADALQMVYSGEITDAKTICSLVKCKAWWKQHEPFRVKFTV